MPVLLVDRSDGIATLTLNRPEAMNALSRDLRRSLASAFRELSGENGVDVVILTGAGDRAFCAGLDLKELGGERPDSPRGSSGSSGSAIDDDVIGAMESCGLPIIAAVNGFAITGGFELALACDVIVGSSTARFADTHARVGILPGWGLSQKLSRLVGIYRAKEASLTGNFVSAERAFEWGLLNHVVEPNELLSTCRALAVDMQSCDREVMRAYKRVIDDGFATNFAAGRDLEERRSREHRPGATPERIAERRKQIQARGREQSH